MAGADTEADTVCQLCRDGLTAAAGQPASPAHATCKYVLLCGAAIIGWDTGGTTTVFLRSLRSSRLVVQRSSGQSSQSYMYCEVTCLPVQQRIPPRGRSDKLGGALARTCTGNPGLAQAATHFAVLETNPSLHNWGHCAGAPSIPLSLPPLLPTHTPYEVGKVVSRVKGTKCHGLPFSVVFHTKNSLAVMLGEMGLLISSCGKAKIDFFPSRNHYYHSQTKMQIIGSSVSLLEITCVFESQSSKRERLSKGLARKLRRGQLVGASHVFHVTLAFLCPRRQR